MGLKFDLNPVDIERIEKLFKRHLRIKMLMHKEKRANVVFFDSEEERHFQKERELTSQNTRFSKWRKGTLDPKKINERTAAIKLSKD